MTNYNQDVTFDINEFPPISVSLCAADRDPGDGSAVVWPRIWGTRNGQPDKCIWLVDGSEGFNDFIEGVHINDILMIKQGPNYNSFAVGGEDPYNYIAAYHPHTGPIMYVDNGLVGVINTLSCLDESSEDMRPDVATLYAGAYLYDGAMQGVYKNHFDFTSSSPWYRLSNGIEPYLRMTSIVTTKHLIDSGEPIDELVVYALGENAAGTEKYAYVSADSGRSWIEFGLYLRDNDILVGNLDLIVDEGTDQKYFLAAAGEDGIFRYPYNVKSGYLAGDETWGPGRIIVNGDVTVPLGVRLTIAAPCTVAVVYGFDRMQGGTNSTKTEIRIQGGELVTIGGSPQNRVVFTSSKPTNKAPGDWTGIVCSGDFNTINLSYATIEFADYGLYSLNGASFGDVNISYSNFRQMTTAGIDLYQPSNPFLAPMAIDYTGFDTCGIYGLRVRADANQTNAPTYIDYCVFRQNGYGIWYSGNSNSAGTKRLQITNSILTRPSHTLGYYGIYISRYSGSARSPIVNLVADSISYFQQGGIQLNSVDLATTMSSNKAKTNGIYGLFLANSSPQLLGSVTQYNAINSNNTGIFCDKYSNPVVRYAKIKRNRAYGVLIENHDGTGGSPDFGAGSNGMNSFEDDPFQIPYYDIYNKSRTAIVYARGNWWGEPVPDPAEFFGPVDYSNHLTYDPLPGLEKRDLGAPVLPVFVELKQNYPNPFNPSTEIEFQIPDGQHVELNVYNICGQLVKSLISGFAEAGTHLVTWDGSNGLSQPVASGIYFYALTTSEGRIAKPMTLVR